MPNLPIVPPRVPLTDPRTGLISREWYRFLMDQANLMGGSALTRTNDSNVTLTLGGSPSAALLAPVSLTLGWSGQLPVSRGGTGASTAASARDALGAAPSVHSHAISDVTGLQIALDDKVSSNTLGANGGVATLDSAGKIPVGQLPAIAITDTYPVSSQAAMLALTAQKGDVAVRSDLNKSFILATDDPTVLENWQYLLTPTDVVQSVNGKVGVVSLTASDVGAATEAYVNARGVRWLGPWSSATTYTLGDGVSYLGSSWRALQASTNVTPTEGAYWTVIAAKGDQGIQGVKGDQGIQGIQGIQGVKGDTGAAGQSVTSVSVTTGAAGSSASSTYNATTGALALTIPRGDTGAQGIQGIQGIQGVKGDTGATGPAWLVWRNAWAASTAYAVNDGVQYLGSTYRCNTAHTSAATFDAAKFDLVAAKGDTGPAGSYGSQTANTFLAAPNGSSGTPSFRAIVASDIPTLNQSTTGTAGGLNGSWTLPDTRSVATTPGTYSGNAALNFKSAGTIGLGGSFAGILGVAPWGDDSGGGSHELAFSDVGFLYYRYGTRSAGWGSWRTILDSGSDAAFLNTASRTVSIASTASGTAGRNLYLQAGGTSAGGTNIAGGTLVLRSGLSTGSARGAIEFHTPSPGLSGTGLNGYASRASIDDRGLFVGGNTRIGDWEPVSGFAFIGNSALNQSISSNYALLQGNVGDTYLNASSGRSLNLRIGNSDVIVMAGSSITASNILVTATPTTTSAGFRLPHGSAPLTPTNGDVWTTVSGLYARVNGSTVGPFISTTGTFSGALDAAVTAVTQATSDNSTKVATTAFVKAAHPVLYAVSSLETTASKGSDMFVDSSVLKVNLTAGTWLVYASVSAYTTDVQDGMQIALCDLNVVPGTAWPNTRSSMVGSTVNYAKAVTTTCVITLSGNYTIGVLLINNGDSTLGIGDTGANNLTDLHRIVAIRLY